MGETKSRNLVGSRGSTHASAVAKQLLKAEFPRYHEKSPMGGFACMNWINDKDGNLLVKVEWRRPERGLRGKTSEATQNRVRRIQFQDMARALREQGYQVEWGWDEETGDPDTSFIVVSTQPIETSDAPALVDSGTPVLKAEDLNEVSQAALVPQQAAPVPELEGLANLLISIPQVEQSALDIALAHQANKQEAARRLEHALYHQVLLAIVLGGEDPRLLAAAALTTQHLSFPR